MFQSYSEKVYRPDLKTQSTHTPEQWALCVLCDKSETPVLFTEEDLEVHRKDVHFEEIKQIMTENVDSFCTICMTLHRNHETLIQHIKTRHLYSCPNARRVEREIFVCGQCNRVFFNKEVLQVHILYIHMGDPRKRKGRFLCPKCRKICYIKSLADHLQLHNIPSISTCDICLTHCPSVYDLMEHVKEHPLHLKCEICNYKTLKDRLFESHLDRHRKDNVNTEALSALKLSKFASKKECNSQIPKYNIHNLFKGLIIPSCIYICVLCREICTTKEQIAEHKIRDHCKTKPFLNPNFRCQCGLYFEYKVLLKHHVVEMKGPHREYTDELPILTDQEIQRAESAIQDKADKIALPGSIEVEIPNKADNKQIVEVVQEITKKVDENKQKEVNTYADANKEQREVCDN